MKSVRLRALRLLRGAGLLRRRIFYVAAALLLFLLYRHFSAEDVDWDNDMAEIELEGRAAANPPVKFHKWIVATTIHRPSETLRLLSTQLAAGWQMVVVGDRKTPANWKLPGVTYLDVKAQKLLRYRVHQYLPYDSYSRKIIGYLYAVEHGAKYIYEVDDDNLPHEDISHFETSDNLQPHLVLDTRNLTANPYVHFGQSSVWPRGYPLDRVGLAADRDYRLCRMRPPAVQQGLANGDPDVDALFRLTRRPAATALNLTFDKAAPTFILPPGTFAPYNAQNTFYRQRAFWALVLPTTVHDRVSDIYRAYWAQRLLWLAGETLAFAPPNVYQRRAGHSDIEDARHEAELYAKVGDYVGALERWQCEETFFFDCASKLTRHLVALGFWGARDADVVDAWIADLSNVGYAPPALLAKPADACETGESTPVTFYPEEQATSATNAERIDPAPGTTNHARVMEKMAVWCGDALEKHWALAVRRGRKYPDVLLVVSVRRDLKSVAPKLEAAYGPHFGHVVYCVNKEQDRAFVRDWRLSVVTVAEEPSAIACLSAAVAMRYHTKGMLHVTDTMWLNAEGSLGAKIPSLAWMTGDFIVYKPATLSMCAARTINCQLMPKDLLVRLSNRVSRMDALGANKKMKLRNCLSKIERDPSWMSQEETVWVTDVAAYLPSRLYRDLALMRDVFTADDDTKRFEFLAMLFIECDQLTVEYLHRTESAEGEGASGADYVYPFFFANVGKVDEATRPFCKHFEQFA